MKLICLSALKGHGKDYFADFIKTVDPSVTQFGFSFVMKEMCARIFGIGLSSLHCPVAKEARLAIPIVMDDFIPKMHLETGLHIERLGLVAHSRRELMQFFGTEYVRSVRPNYWICKFLEKLDTLSGTFVITDGRFPNELELVKGRGGKLVFLARESKIDEVDSPSATLHESESLMLQMRAEGKFDIERIVSEGEDLTEFAKQLLNA